MSHELQFYIDGAWVEPVVAHVLEIVPGLIVGAGMGGAVPEIFGQVLGRLGDAAIAGADAVRRLAHARFRFRLLRLAGLDADIAFEARWTGLNH